MVRAVNRAEKGGSTNIVLILDSDIPAQRIWAGKQGADAVFVLPAEEADMVVFLLDYKASHVVENSSSSSKTNPKDSSGLTQIGETPLSTNTTTANLIPQDRGQAIVTADLLVRADISLSRIVGPAARAMVSDAARTANTSEAFLDLLMDNLENENDKTDFIDGVFN